MSTTNTSQLRSVFHDGKERNIKRIDLQAGEEVRHTKDLTRLSTHTRYSLTFGILIVTNQRVLFSPAGYTRRVPAETWSADLDDIKSIQYERKGFNVKDLAVGLFMHPAAKIARRITKTLCIETVDGQKQYFTIESQFNRTVHLNHLRKHKIEEVADELRTATEMVRASSAVDRPRNDRDERASTDSGSEHPVATAVVVGLEPTPPAEKESIRQHLRNRTVTTGQVLNVDGSEITVLSTNPTTGSAFSAPETAVAERTRIRFD